MSKPDLTRISVLVVDDEEFMRMLLARLLNDLKVKSVITAEDGVDAALKFKLNRLKVDLIVCDLMMPNVSGLQFVKSVRAGETACAPDVPVLLLTGVGDEEVVRAAAGVGIHGYLRKPVSVDSLRKHVHSALTRPMINPLDGEGESEPTETLGEN